MIRNIVLNLNRKTLFNSEQTREDPWSPEPV